MKELVFGKLGGTIVRHVATTVGGMLLAAGYADEATAQALTGALVTLGGFMLSAANKIS